MRHRWAKVTKHPELLNGFGKAEVLQGDFWGLRCGNVPSSAAQRKDVYRHYLGHHCTVLDNQLTVSVVEIIDNTA